MEKKTEKLGMHQNAKPQIFRNAKRLRYNMTETESLVWNKLNNKQLGVRFRRQHPVGKFIVDFYCHAKFLVVEIDGGYHESGKQIEFDSIRSTTLENSGLKIIRFTDKEVYENLNGVIKKIKSYIRD